MSPLLRKQTAKAGKVHDITVETAKTPLSPDWGYVGFGLHHLKAGDVVAEATGDREVILVMIEGKAKITGAGQDWGELGDRMSVFERTPPHCLYLPNGVVWRAEAVTDCVIAVARRLVLVGTMRRLLAPLALPPRRAARARIPAISMRLRWKNETLRIVCW